jgi:hypothetical protein
MPGWKLEVGKITNALDEFVKLNLINEAFGLIF